jgi:hypothetical protein
MAISLTTNAAERVRDYLDKLNASRASAGFLQPWYGLVRTALGSESGPFY